LCYRERRAYTRFHQDEEPPQWDPNPNPNPNGKVLYDEEPPQWDWVNKNQLNQHLPKSNPKKKKKEDEEPEKEKEKVKGGDRGYTTTSRESSSPDNVPNKANADIKEVTEIKAEVVNEDVEVVTSECAARYNSSPLNKSRLYIEEKEKIFEVIPLTLGLGLGLQGHSIL